MKRYKAINWGKCGHAQLLQMIEDTDGEWVKYSDVEKEMKKIWGDIMPPPGDILKAMCKGTQKTGNTRTVRITLKYKNQLYEYTDDFDKSCSEELAVYMYEEGNYSCDCNRSVFIRQHCDPKFKEMECGNKIELISIKAITGTKGA